MDMTYPAKHLLGLRNAERGRSVPGHVMEQQACKAGDSESRPGPHFPAKFVAAELPAFGGDPQKPIVSATEEISYQYESPTESNDKSPPLPGHCLEATPPGPPIPPSCDMALVATATVYLWVHVILQYAKKKKAAAFRSRDRQVRRSLTTLQNLVMGRNVSFGPQKAPSSLRPEGSALCISVSA